MLGYVESTRDVTARPAVARAGTGCLMSMHTRYQGHVCRLLPPVVHRSDYSFLLDYNFFP